MARKTQKRAATTRRRSYQPQDLLLAGIGAISLGRKQIANAYSQGFDGVVELTDRTQEVVQSAVSTLNDQVADIRKRAVSLRKQVEKQVAGLRKQARTSLVPVLARLGVKPVPTRRPSPRAAVAATRRRTAA